MLGNNQKNVKSFFAGSAFIIRLLPALQNNRKNYSGPEPLIGRNSYSELQECTGTLFITRRST